MIAQLTGIIASRDERAVILDVNGVGYKLALSLETLGGIKVGDKLTLQTHLAVRENALDLYGFADQRELEFFELLLTVSGIGPKSALATLSLAPPDVLQKAILSGDASYLTKVSGVGKKSAEKIVLELKDKLGTLEGHQSDTLQTEAEAVEALQALGYSLAEARRALKDIPAEIADTGERVKHALQYLGK